MDYRTRFRSSFLLLTAALLWHCRGAHGASSIAAEPKDTREGENVTLTCRFPPEPSAQNLTSYWLRTNKRKPDNVAVNGIPLDNNYRLEFSLDEGRYDLLIMNVSYERDNGQFECRVKAPGSGVDLHAQAVRLTVLMQPEPPKIVQGPKPTATEGKPFTLTCSSAGGSPDPQIQWYRVGGSQPLDAVVRPGSGREPSTATLTLNATRADDGAVFRCQVWNRALPGNTKLEAVVTLNVNYYPRVDIGPDNPIRVERDASARLQCNVDAKPRVTNVRWTRNNVFISNQMTHTLQRVTIHDAGLYVCSAENGLGQVGQAELKLDVLYPPQVTVETSPGSSKQREVEEGDSVTVQCNVSANPPPTIIEWVREGHPEFRQMGKTLTLQQVTAESAGTYTCRAVNYIEPTTAPRRRVEHVGNASMTLLVRHRPGQARISPDTPIATEGNGVTLSCSASPPGWPAPTYRWWREIVDPHSNVPTSTPISILSTGPKYTISSAHLGIEGTYHCEANNELGHGEPASVRLQVHQAPRFSEKLAPHSTKKVGDKDFYVRCAAQCKPKPSIRWLKDGREIEPSTLNGLGSNLFTISTEDSEGRNGIHTVQSVLRFMGADRSNGSQLQPFDSGVYSCVFENEVKRVESSMLLSIEHKPILLNRYDKVAYDLQEDAYVVCKVQAYPKPEFQWSYGTNPAVLLTSSTGHYEINTTYEGDVYTSTLKVTQIRDNDYGEYICRANNGQGALKAIFHLQPKGSPEPPRSLKTTVVGYNFVTLQWEPGFNGGLQNTKYFVSYRRVAGGLSAGGEDQNLASDCYSAGDVVPNINVNIDADSASGWQEFDCQRNNPCNVTSLEQHASYVFKVKALNTKGNSNHSEIVAAQTKVDRIPAPQRVAFDPESHMLSINVAATCLQLIAQVDVTFDLPNENRNEVWNTLERLTMSTSGSGPTRRDATLKSLVERSMEYPPLSSGRSLGLEKDDVYSRRGSEDNILDSRDYHSTAEPRVRVRLCLRPDPDTCGEFAEAEIGPSYIKEASVLATPTLIAIVVSCIVFVLFLGLLFTFCRCKRHNNKKAGGKNYEMNSSNVRPSIMTQQPPPPYFHENKALEHSLDLAIDDATKGHHLYTTQNGYGYHGGSIPTHHQHLGVNMGYMENSYSNSNNGGSVNSQDSLWQMKMAAAASNNGSHTGVPDSQQYLHNHGNPLAHGGMERSNSAYGYDPLAHGGYGAVDDYGMYPHLTPTPGQGQDEYGRHLSQGRNSANPSRQDYSSSVDPYAAVQKPRRRDAQLDSPYHDVSGLPDPYSEQLDIDEKPPHHGLTYDESLESGYSTPNSRNRRVIREIIV